MFALVGKYAPPPPGVAPSPQWGEVGIVRERLGTAVRDLAFERGIMLFPTPSPGHYRMILERTAGPLTSLVNKLQPEPTKLAALREELETILGVSFDPSENVVRQGFLMTRAIKV